MESGGAVDGGASHATGGAGAGGSASLGDGGRVASVAGAPAGGGAGTAGAAAGSAGVEAGGSGTEPEKIVLFDGSADMFHSRWLSTRNGAANPWQYNEDGTMTVGLNAGDIESEEKFANVFVHLEYMTPKFSFENGGQSQGNSGVLLNGSYELQILALEAFRDPTPTEATCGAVFGLTAPLEIACRAGELWNTYEIEFRAPLCDGPNRVVTPARFVEVKLNGTVIHRDVEVLQKTTAARSETCDRRGLVLQDWYSTLPVSFRNIWAIRRD